MAKKGEKKEAENDPADTGAEVPEGKTDAPAKDIDVRENDAPSVIAADGDTLTDGDRTLLYAILAVSLLSLLISLYVLYVLGTGQTAALGPPANGFMDWF